MASNLARLTGTVLSTPEPFRGVSKATGNPFSIETVKVLVADEDVTTLNFNRDPETGQIRGLDGQFEFKKDELVDVLAEVGTYRNEPQFTLRRQWKPSAAELAAAETALLNA